MTKCPVIASIHLDYTDEVRSTPGSCDNINCIVIPNISGRICCNTRELASWNIFDGSEVVYKKPGSIGGMGLINLRQSTSLGQYFLKIV